MATHSSLLAWSIPWTEAWRATVHGIAKSQTQLKRLSTLFHCVYGVLTLTSEYARKKGGKGDSMYLRSHPVENGIALFWCGVYSGGDGRRLREWLRKGSLTQTVTWGSERFGLFQDSLNSVSRASKISLTKALFPPLWFHVALFRYNLISHFLPWDITETFLLLLLSHFGRVWLCVIP